MADGAGVSPEIITPPSEPEKIADQPKVIEMGMGGNITIDSLILTGTTSGEKRGNIGIESRPLSALSDEDWKRISELPFGITGKGGVRAGLTINHTGELNNGLPDKVTWHKSLDIDVGNLTGTELILGTKSLQSLSLRTERESDDPSQTTEQKVKVISFVPNSPLQIAGNNIESVNISYHSEMRTPEDQAEIDRTLAEAWERD